MGKFFGRSGDVALKTWPGLVLPAPQPLSLPVSQSPSLPVRPRQKENRGCPPKKSGGPKIGRPSRPPKIESLRLFCSVLRLCRGLTLLVTALGRFAPLSLLQTLSWLISSAPRISARVSRAGGETSVVFLLRATQTSAGAVSFFLGGLPRPMVQLICFIFWWRGGHLKLRSRRPVGANPCSTFLGPVVVPFSPLFWLGGSPIKIDDRKKKGYPFSNLSTGGPSCSTFGWRGFHERRTNYQTKSAMFCFFHSHAVDKIHFAPVGMDGT